MSIYEKLPKVNLHHHLEGAVRPETFLEVVKQKQLNIPINNVEDAKSYLMISGQEASLGDFLEKIGRTFAISQFPGVLKRLALETLEDAANDSVRYIEVRYGPWLHVEQGRAIEETIEEVLAGLREGESQFGVKGRLIISALRHHSYEQNKKLIEAAVRFKEQGVVAIDLAGDEQQFPATKFQNLFAKAKDEGLERTVHAGEAGTAENVWEAISKLHATRIGHGTRLIDRQDLLNKAIELGIVLEICVTSNVHTKAVSSLMSHPLKKYFEAGLPITIGDDDPTTSAITLSDEFQILADKLRFSTEQLISIILNGGQASFLPRDEKKALIEDLKLELSTWKQNLPISL